MAFGILYDYLMGQSINAYDYFGAHFIEEKKKVGRRNVVTKGVVFRLYAPMATDVSVIGEWNNWDPTVHKMNKVDEAGKLREEAGINLDTSKSKINIFISY